MTQRYMHLSPAALDSAIRLLDGGRGGSKDPPYVREAAQATDGPKDFANMVATGRRT